MSSPASNERVCRGCEHSIPWDWVFCAWCGFENDRPERPAVETAREHAKAAVPRLATPCWCGVTHLDTFTPDVETKPTLTYPGACKLLADYAIALHDRQCCGDELQPQYIAALKACTDAMGVAPDGST